MVCVFLWQLTSITILQFIKTAAADRIQEGIACESGFPHQLLYSQVWWDILRLCRNPRSLVCSQLEREAGVSSQSSLYLWPGHCDSILLASTSGTGPRKARKRRELNSTVISHTLGQNVESSFSILIIIFSEELQLV